MSTILDALRKAQDETANGVREVRVDEIPAPGEAVDPPRARSRRALVWLAGVAGVLALAFVGGLALGNRVSDLFLGRSEPEAEPAVAAQDTQAAPAASERAATARAERPARAERRRERSVDAPPPDRLAVAPAAPESAPRQAPRVAAEAPQRASGAQPAAAEAPVPTPYGRLHVFGAAEAPAPAAANAEDRAARLRELREKMLKARLEAGGRSGGRGEPPVAIVVPPAPGAAAGEAAPAAPAPGTDALASADAAALREVARAAGAAAGAAPRDLAEPRTAPIGVSVGAENPEDTGGVIRDPDIVMQDDEAAPVVEPEAAPEVDAAPAAAPAEAAAVVAAVPRQDPVPAASPPVLRRAPGGAPQVSINILQWSAEPGRRFAFVSVDGGGMTQVREGDRIGGLTVKHIHQQMIEFGFNDSTFLLRAN